jgi:hypothetical protein
MLNVEKASVAEIKHKINIIISHFEPHFIKQCKTQLNDYGALFSVVLYTRNSCSRVLDCWYQNNNNIFLIEFSSLMKNSRRILNFDFAINDLEEIVKLFIIDLKKLEQRNRQYELKTRFELIKEALKKSSEELEKITKILNNVREQKDEEIYGNIWKDFGDQSMTYEFGDYFDENYQICDHQTLILLIESKCKTIMSQNDENKLKFQIISDYKAKFDVGNI